MPSRRTVLAWLSGSPFATLVGTGDAAAAPPAGRLFEGVFQTTGGPGLVPVRLGGFVRLGAPLPSLSRWVFSLANANDRYALVLQLPRMPDQSTYLTVSGGALSSSSYGSGFGGKAAGSVVFHADRTLADEVAGLWKVSRLDRTPIGGGLSGRFRPKGQPFVVGSPMEIVLEVENKGPDTVGFTIGGRQRGPRDNRFAFVVSQQGKLLPVVDAYDLGGLMSYHELKPGDRREVRADLASWTAIPSPGVYQVRCAYQAEVTPSAGGHSWPDHGHEVWDLTLSETIDLTVG